VAAARPERARQAHPVRGRAGRAARRRPRHLSYVTSSNTVARRPRPQRLGPSAVGYVPGHLQGLTDPGPAGPFPPRTGQRDRPQDRRARAESCEHNTGRPAPACGWFDAMLVRQTVRTCGINGLALTRSIFSTVSTQSRSAPVTCWTARKSDHTAAGRGRAGPGGAGLRDHRGLEEPTAMPSWADLPAQAIKYVRRVEELVGCPNRLLPPARNARILFCPEPVRGLTGFTESPQCE